MNIQAYLINCFYLLIPIFIWNLLFYSSLPPSFDAAVLDNNIPNWILYGEQLFRVLVFIFPLSMRFSLKTKSQKVGLFFYLIGVFFYFCSWVMLMLFPESSWGLSLYGYLAPALTPSIWLIGIALIGRNSFLKFQYNVSLYSLLSLCFISLHALHSYLAFQNFN